MPLSRVDSFAVGTPMPARGTLAFIEVRSFHISYPAMEHMREPEPEKFTAIFLSILHPSGSTTTSGSLTFEVLASEAPLPAIQVCNSYLSAGTNSAVR